MRQFRECHHEFLSDRNPIQIPSTLASSVKMATLYERISSNTSDNTAIIVPSRAPNCAPIFLSHRELLQQVLSFQKKLAAIGIAPKDAVALSFCNTIEFAIAFLATTCQRAIAAPLNSAYKQDEVEFYLEDLHASIILLPRGAVAENGEAVRAAKKCGTAIAEIYWDELEIVLKIKDEGNFMSRKTVQVERPLESDVALILHTSGTTGRPKAVRRFTHNEEDFADFQGPSKPQEFVSNHNQYHPDLQSEA